MTTAIGREGDTMLAKPVLRHILDDALTRGLGDLEARVLVDWLVDRAEKLDAQGRSAEEIEAIIMRWCRRGRALGRFVSLWCQRQHAAALQLVGTERFAWPMPHPDAESDELMLDILTWEARQEEESLRKARGEAA
jgi:hypothetical protein